jgi:hypothetical protein
MNYRLKIAAAAALVTVIAAAGRMARRAAREAG